MLVSLSLALSLTGSPDAAADFRAAAKVLSDHCVRCHNGEKTRGGLDLSSRGTALAGGATADALVPGKPDESGLLARAADGSMPPEKDGRRLTKEEIAVLTRWIAGGATWPEDQPLPLQPEVKAGQVSVPSSPQSTRTHRRFFRRHR